VVPISRNWENIIFVLSPFYTGPIRRIIADASIWGPPEAGNPGIKWRNTTLFLWDRACEKGGIAKVRMMSHGGSTFPSINTGTTNYQ